MSAQEIVVLNLVAAIGAMLVLWLLSLRLRDVSIVDPWWGPGFVLLAALAAGLTDSTSPRRFLLAAMTALWGLRLGWHLLRRKVGHPEDFRYAAMRAHHGERFGIVSLFTVFLLQGALMWFISLPVQLGIVATEPADLGPLDALGVLVWLVGLAFETTGDRQLARFKADPANRGRILDTGLWRYTRHPNYFGDAVVWWGLWLVAASTPAARPAILAPLLMTFLLVRVSGVALLEQTLRQRPGYEEYVRRTSAFLPRPPRRD